jgi:hypothetical protein
MSIVRADQIANRAGTGPAGLVGQSAAKAWLNHNGAATPSVRGSLNVSSVTSGGTGIYTPNFTNAFANINYAAVPGASRNTSWDENVSVDNFSNGAVQIQNREGSSTARNANFVLLACHGDLA